MSAAPLGYMTGRYPMRLSATRANLIPWSLVDGINTSYTYLPKHLKQKGYRTHHVGKVRRHAPGERCIPARAFCTFAQFAALLLLSTPESHLDCSLQPQWHNGFYEYAMTPPGRGFDTR
eukprot:SAG11_NODE_723_length_7528_cov_4.998385_4_plen_119_part_00